MNLAIFLWACPCLCPCDWKVRWNGKKRNYCDFVSLTQPPNRAGANVRLASAASTSTCCTHSGDDTPSDVRAHRLTLLKGKHFQHTVMIRNSTSLQTSPSCQPPELIEGSSTPHHTTRWLHQDRKTKSHQNRLHHPRYCAQSVQHTISCVGFGKMNRAVLSKSLAYSVSVTEVLVIPSATQLCYNRCVLRVVSRSSKDHLSFFS